MKDLFIWIIVCIMMWIIWAYEWWSTALKSICRDNFTTQITDSDGRKCTDWVKIYEITIKEIWLNSEN